MAMQPLVNRRMDGSSPPAATKKTKKEKYMVKTRLGIMSLVDSGSGSVELPEEITLYCPQCGTEVADKGQCLAELAKVPGESKTGFIVKLMVDCRCCGCLDREPGIAFK